jgi:tetratricopeptide (TPR) repeat protein
VATVLEGSVRKAGNRVRIAAQLVNAATDSHLWSQTYDRELEDIFAVQDDIAQSVVKELRSVLLREQRDSSTSALQAEVRAAAKRHSKNAEAYRLYLQGRFQVARRTREDVAKAIEYLQRATELDPEYALAWAAAAYAHTVAAFTGWIARAEGFGRARRAAERALALDPDLDEGHTALAHVRMDYEWDWTGADVCSQRALDLAPGNAEVALNAAWAATPLGRLDESITLCRRAIALDPVNVQAHRYLGYFSLFAGLLEEAEAALKEALDLNPLGGFTHTHLGEVYLLQGRFPEALAEFEKESHAAMRLMGRSAANFALGRKAASSTALQELGQVPVNAFLNAQAHAYCGNVDPAFEWLERAYSQRDAGLCHMKLEPCSATSTANPGGGRW